MANSKYTSRRQFEGEFAIVRNTKGVVTLRKRDDYTDSKGFQYFTAKDVRTVAEKFKNAESKGLEVSYFKPEPDGNEPVILHKYGNPYLAFLPPMIQNNNRPVVEDISSLI